MASTKPMNIYMGVGVTAFPITFHAKKNGNAIVTMETRFFQICFLTKYECKKVKIKKLLFDFFSFFVFLSLF